MGILSRIRHQRDQRQVSKASGLDGFGGSSAPITERPVGGFVLGNPAEGFRSGEPARRKEHVSVLSHAPDFAPEELSSETGKRRRKPAKNCGNSADAHDRRLWKLLVAFWRRRFPKKTAEQIAARHGVSVRVAYEWLSGKLPPIWHFARMIAVEGSDFLREVIHKLAKHDDGKSRFRVRVPVLRRQTQGA